jgi:hypothetical protein
MNPILEQLASHGPIGLVAVIALYGLMIKDRDLKLEREARLEDRKNCSAEITALHSKYQEELGEERHARLVDERAHTQIVTSSNERLFLAIETTKQICETMSNKIATTRGR